MRPLLALASAVLLAGLVRFASARPAIEVRLPRSAPASTERRDLARFDQGVTVRVSSVYWAARHHPAYLVDGATRPSPLEKWVSAPGDARPWAEVQLDGPHDVDEVALELAGAHEPPSLTERSFRVDCFAGARLLSQEAIVDNSSQYFRKPVNCRGADRVRVTFAPQGVARVYELEAWGR